MPRVLRTDARSASPPYKHQKKSWSESLHQDDAELQRNAPVWGGFKTFTSRPTCLASRHLQDPCKVTVRVREKPLTDRVNDTFAEHHLVLFGLGHCFSDVLFTLRTMW